MKMLTIGLVLIIAAFVSAAGNEEGFPPEPRVAVPLDGAQPLLAVRQERQPAVLTQIDADGRFLFNTHHGVESIQQDDLVRWGQPVEGREGVRVVLVDGSVLAVAPAWTVHEQVHFENDSFQVATQQFGIVPISRKHIAKIVFQPNDQVLVQPDESPQLDHKKRPSDIVVLANRDQLRGIVKSIDQEGVELETTNTTAKIRSAGVVAVHFRLARPNPSKIEQTVLLGTRDGSRLAVRRFMVGSVAPGIRSLTTTCGVELPMVSLGDVVFIQSLGGKAQYVSDRTPSRYRHIPYLEITWPFRLDRNVLGGPLCAGGADFVKGIGVHSASRLVYKHDGSRARFAADVAIDSSAGQRGSVLFRVFVAQNGKWREAAKSQIVRGGDPPLPISVELEKANGFALVVDYADYGDEWDHAIWLDARVE